MTIDVDAWERAQRQRLLLNLENTSARLKELLVQLALHVRDPVVLRTLLEEFEDSEGEIDPDLTLLDPFYELLEVSWDEATHHELVTAALGTFGEDGP